MAEGLSTEQNADGRHVWVWHSLIGGEIRGDEFDTAEQARQAGCEWLARKSGQW